MFSAVDFEALVGKSVREGGENDKDAEMVPDDEIPDMDETAASLPSTSSNGVKSESQEYQALLVKARGSSGGEKAFKRVLIAHASARMGEMIQAGASDHERVKARAAAVVELNRHVSPSR